MSRCRYEYDDYADYAAYEEYEDEAVAVAAAEEAEVADGFATRRTFESEPFQNTRLVQEYARPRTWTEYVWYEVKYIGPFHYGPVVGPTPREDVVRNERISQCVANANSNNNTNRRRRRCCPCRCNCGCGCGCRCR